VEVSIDRRDYGQSTRFQETQDFHFQFRESSQIGAFSNLSSQTEDSVICRHLSRSEAHFPDPSHPDSSMFDIRKMLKSIRPAVDRTLSLIGYKHSDRQLELDADAYWKNQRSQDFQVNSHWRGTGIFTDEDRWAKIGAFHRSLFNDMSKMSTFQSTSRGSRILEWGCGGGANAISFASIASTYIGADVSNASLNECSRQMNSIDFQNFQPLQICLSSPSLPNELRGTFDIFLCTYVYELLPSKEYGLRVLEIARDSLFDGGLAFVQIRYATNKPSTQGRTWGYSWGMTKMVAYFIDEFWAAAKQIGFEPLCVVIVPFDPIVEDERYAYFLFQKPTARAS
jgi:2-polyprenyl-3-methyl-5-hydroxy-6-metoxy-1,4-benzoquinol methylase